MGPLLAGWLFQHALGWMFWLDALTTAAALVLLVCFVPRKTAPNAPVDARPGAPSTSAVRAFVKHPVLFPLSVLVLVYNLVYSQMIFTLSLQMVALFGTQGPRVGVLLDHRRSSFFGSLRRLDHVSHPEAFRGRFQAFVGFVGSGGFVTSPLLSGLVVQSLGFFLLGRSVDRPIIPG